MFRNWLHSFKAWLYFRKEKKQKKTLLMGKSKSRTIYKIITKTYQNKKNKNLTLDYE